MITTTDLWLIRIATVLTGGTGLVYAAMRYLLHPPDEWSLVNHPWQPHVQHVHILVAPVLIFAVAVVWRSHALTKQHSGGKIGRFSGWGLMVVFWPMATSGFLVQVSVSETWRDFWSLSHLICALIWLATATGHIIASVQKRRRQQGAINQIPIIQGTPHQLPTVDHK